MCSLLTASQSSSCPAPDAATQGQQGRAEPNAPGDAAQTRVANLCSKQLSKSSLLVRNLSGYPQASFLLRLWHGAAWCRSGLHHLQAEPTHAPQLRPPACGAAPAQRALLPLSPKKQLQQHRCGTALFLPLSYLKQK